MRNSFIFILKFEIYALFFFFCNYKEYRWCDVFETIKTVQTMNVNFIVIKMMRGDVDMVCDGD